MSNRRTIGASVPRFLKTSRRAAAHPGMGGMPSEGRKFIRNAPHLSIIPGTAIFLVVLALNFLGDGLRDAHDPRLRE